jgi:3-oxoacyl-[acyl-carrier protein] reductase
MTSKLLLQGKTAVVTGGSRGIGAGIALELGMRGANVGKYIQDVCNAFHML